MTDKLAEIEALKAEVKRLRARARALLCPDCWDAWCDSTDEQRQAILKDGEAE